MDEMQGTLRALEQTEDAGARPGSPADRDLAGDFEEELDAAEARGDDVEASLMRDALLSLGQPELARLRTTLVRYLTGMDRDFVMTTWRDEGIVGLRLRVPLGDAGLPAGTPGITFWVREGDDGLELLVDQADAPLPTDFARRTVRLYPAGAYGAKRIEHVIAAEATVIL